MTERPRVGKLSDLVYDTRSKAGLSLRRLAHLCTIAAPPGTLDPRTKKPLRETLYYAWIGRLETGEMREAPNPIELEALARGLGLKSRQVKLAAAAQYFALRPVEVQHPDRPGEVVEVITADIDSMSPDQLRQLIRAAEARIQRDEPAPDTP